MTRAGSLRLLAAWGAVVLVATVALYLPTLIGGSPWSWHVAEVPRLVLLLFAFGAGLLAGHWWWPTTDRWPGLERFCAAVVDEWERGAPPVDEDLEDLRELVRPHVLERARRGR